MNEDVIGVSFNQHWFDEKLQMIGVGPYILTEYTPDRVVAFERNPAYWGKGDHFARIEWNAEIKDPNSNVNCI